MVEWHHQFNGHVSEQTPGDGKGQGNLVYYSPWEHRVRHDLVTGQQQPVEEILSNYEVYEEARWKAF